jgi:hypothetical protein
MSIYKNEREKVGVHEKIVSINFNILAKVLVFLWSERMFVALPQSRNANFLLCFGWVLSERQ